MRSSPKAPKANHNPMDSWLNGLFSPASKHFATTQNLSTDNRIEVPGPGIRSYPKLRRAALPIES
jgi:hypothetical protein